MSCCSVDTEGANISVTNITQESDIFLGKILKNIRHYSDTAQGNAVIFTFDGFSVAIMVRV